MKKYDFYGKCEDGTSLEINKIYKARETDPDADDKNFRFFRAVRNGSLFSMWKVDEKGRRNGGYVLPQYLEFE